MHLITTARQIIFFEEVHNKSSAAASIYDALSRWLRCCAGGPCHCNLPSAGQQPLHCTVTLHLHEQITNSTQIELILELCL